MCFVSNSRPWQSAPSCNITYIKCVIFFLHLFINMRMRFTLELRNDCVFLKLVSNENLYGILKYIVCQGPFSISLFLSLSLCVCVCVVQGAEPLLRPLATVHIASFDLGWFTFATLNWFINSMTQGRSNVVWLLLLHASEVSYI